VRRTSTGGSSSVSTVSAAPAPYWLKVIRNGNAFSAWRSANGTSWTQVGSTVTISMSGSVLVGLAVDSQSTSTLNTSTFDNVYVSTSTSSSFTPPATIAATDTSGDIMTTSSTSSKDNLSLLQ
jgi:hypothetical protein